MYPPEWGGWWKARAGCDPEGCRRPHPLPVIFLPAASIPLFFWEALPLYSSGPGRGPSQFRNQVWIQGSICRP